MASHQNDDGKQSGRGFSGMDSGRQHEAAGKGGHASHQGGQQQPPEHGSAKDDQAHLKQGNQANVKPGDPSHMRSGSSEQHAKAGAQSQKNK